MAAEPRLDPLGSRLETLEAAALLCFARLLVALVRFERWRSWLGEPVKGGAETGGVARIDRHCARVVRRALGHLPLTFKCLPQAMALHWMLQRRGRPSQIVLSALPKAVRAGQDDLHAWTEIGGEVLIGESDRMHHVLVRFGTNQA